MRKPNLKKKLYHFDQLVLHVDIAQPEHLHHLIREIGLAISGRLADYVFELTMQPTGILAGVLGGVFGIGEGSGMALQYTLFCLVAIALCGYLFPILPDVEKIIPDDQSQPSVKQRFIVND
jgi:hypothetical protein